MEIGKTFNFLLQKMFLYEIRGLSLLPHLRVGCIWTDPTPFLQARGGGSIAKALSNYLCP
ncbi:hypothetical protein TSUD_180080 [Trifolium subterraneum]|uniref:Uncharacterized protein n=1 Tax=Trifolium subterraneum TaxID=3900 RepID=A0A2Z6PAI6_TRISU|nr:hypothetical protein TSUD_180080 [Trifolium subterraneum]